MGTPKLTKAQRQLLEDCAEDDRGMTGVVASYAPAKILVQRGLASWLLDDPFSGRLLITPAGREALEEPRWMGTKRAELTKAQRLVSQAILLSALPISLPLFLIYWPARGVSTAVEWLYDRASRPFLRAVNEWERRCERANQAKEHRP